MSDLKTNLILAKEKGNGKESSSEIRLSALLSKANTMPKTSGCYFMKGSNGEIIYVGKAKSLKSRVSSYFNNSSKSPKTQILVSHIYEFDFILTQSDAESFVLENNLIKKHKPKYNIMLKDDKTYPYLSINFNQDFPRLEYVRRPKRKKNVELFGPFPVGSNISKILRVLTKAFRLRDCSVHEFNSRKTACILYQMNQCSAPCVDLIGKKDYRKDLDMAVNFFRNKKKVVRTLGYLTDVMMNHAEKEEFELAGIVRDYLEELDEFAEKSFEQNVESLSSSNCDIVSYYVGDEEIDISLYLIRQGNLIGHKNFNFLNADLFDETENEVVQAMLQYYSQNSEVLPDKIITDLSKDHASEFEQALGQIIGEGIRFSVHSKTKKYESLINSTRNHAEESQRVRIKNQDSVFVGLNRLKNLLNLKDRPKVLECYDIAIWQGKSPTASQIVFYEGKPDKTQYRHYHMTELPEGNNDFAMMREVFERRLKYGNFPDVFIVDGGIQQVNTVQKVLDALEVEIPVIGIAKARDLKKAGFRSAEVKLSEERLVIPNRSNPFILNKCPALMRIVVQMRDEAHRFSRRLHHKTEKKRVIHSWIDTIKGLNKEIKAHILRTNTLAREELFEMNITELQNFLGLETKHARILYDFLHAEEN
jgi:excinuclease ABC subunit C